jgi:uncharacterized protein
MATAGLLALLDDIATLLDDVAILTKVAAKKTSGVLGDDLALSAEQVAGVRPQRELPLVWAVAKGSLLNKAILVPIALLISAVAPWAITPLLMLGGGFLCFEGVEKLLHKFLHARLHKVPHAAEHAQAERAHHAELLAAVVDPTVDLVALERSKISGAVRTDFILSAEIVAIALGTVAHKPFVTRVIVLTGVGILVTVGVYGLVAAIVKLDDLGLYMMRRAEGRAAPQSLEHRLGALLVKTAPALMRILSVAGTAAMFLVGGGILTHGTPGVHDWVHHQTEAWHAVPVLPAFFPTLVDVVVGVLAGTVALLGVGGARRLAKSLSH